MQAFPSRPRMFLLAKAPCWNSRREEKMGRVKGSGKGEEKRLFFFLPSTCPLSVFRPHIYPEGYYFHSPQSSSVIKSKMAATTIRTWTSFRHPKYTCTAGYPLSEYMQWNYAPFNVKINRLTSISSNKIIKLPKYLICGHSSRVIPLIETVLYLSHARSRNFASLGDIFFGSWQLRAKILSNSWL